MDIFFLTSEVITVRFKNGSTYTLYLEQDMQFIEKRLTQEQSLNNTRQTRVQQF